jgi:hypothetical protein
VNKPVIKKVNGSWVAVGGDSYRCRQLMWPAMSFARKLNQIEGIQAKGRKSTRKERRIHHLYDDGFHSALDFGRVWLDEPTNQGRLLRSKNMFMTYAEIIATRPERMAKRATQKAAQKNNFDAYEYEEADQELAAIAALAEFEE